MDKTGQKENNCEQIEDSNIEETIKQLIPVQLYESLLATMDQKIEKQVEQLLDKRFKEAESEQLNSLKEEINLRVDLVHESTTEKIDKLRE